MFKHHGVPSGVVTRRSSFAYLRLMSRPAGDRTPRVRDLRTRLEGRLVVLEPLTADHELGLFEAARDGSLFEWMPEDLSGSREQLHSWLAWSLSAAQQDREVPFAILAAESGKPVGSTRFFEIRLEHLRVEIGWTWLARSVWSSGVNVEAKLLLLTHVFERVGCRRVEFKTDARNARSRGALEALGASFEGIFRKHMIVQRGAPRDSAYYSVIDDEWPEVKALLERRLEQRHRLSTPITD
jgi:RimJ/RimL family protein N-acetyltransferase